MLKNIKKRIEDEFLTSVKSKEDTFDEVEYKGKGKNLVNKQYHKKKGIMRMIEENKHEEDDVFER